MARLVLFPGLGSDERAYAPQASLPVPFEVARWIAPLSERESLADYSKRLAHTINDRDGVILGGFSLGAMVALEAARHLNARGVILIGGCASRRQVALPFRLLLRMATLLPAWGIRFLLLPAPLALRGLEGLNKEQARAMTRMLREHDPRHTRWSAGAILGWTLAAPPACPAWAIHGERDEVIPLAGVRPDAVVPGGRHLIHLRHPEEVNRFVMSHLLAQID